MNEALRTSEHHGVRWFTFRCFDPWQPVMAVVSSRHGGVSSDGKATLNLSYAVGDVPERVTENRRRLVEAIGINGTPVICAAQVHGCNVAVVDESAAGAGFSGPMSAIQTVDALVTDRPNLALWLGFADCVPIVVYDPDRPAIGIAHAGWRGTLLEVSRCLIETMQAAFGSRPAALRVAIGPSIGPCCYEVGPDVEAAFRDRWRALSVPIFRHAGDHRHLNLWEANRRSLLAAGVPAEQIALTNTCTACEVGDFFSHRAQRGQAGRFAVIVGLREGG
jgi:YfiH family protein